MQTSCAPGLDQARLLSVLTRTPADAIKTFAEGLLPLLGEIEVLENRIGLTMLPMRDPRAGDVFYLGEVLLAEARVRVAGTEGYAACLGRDLTQALAVALLDAAYRAGIAVEDIGAFVCAQEATLLADDETLLRQVEATRIEMETFEWLMSTST